MTVTVILSKALICIAAQCFPALIGNSTPTGEFPMQHRATSLPGYGGDVMAFAEDKSGVYAVHRVWLLSPKQHRLERLNSLNVSDRQGITGGCINVAPNVYDLIVDCCSRSTLVVTP